MTGEVTQASVSVDESGTFVAGQTDTRKFHEDFLSSLQRNACLDQAQLACFEV
jgi:hypothetical protein